MLDRSDILSKVIKVDTGYKTPCWLWTGYTDKDGYGRYYTGRRNERRSHSVYRLTYILWVGDIEKGYVIDHLCRVRKCCNPDHLEKVTHKENTLRGNGPTAINARKKVCIRGHEMLGRKRDGRYCKECDKL